MTRCGICGQVFSTSQGVKSASFAKSKSGLDSNPEQSIIEAELVEEAPPQRAQTTPAKVPPNLTRSKSRDDRFQVKPFSLPPALIVATAPANADRENLLSESPVEIISSAPAAQSAEPIPSRHHWSASQNNMMVGGALESHRSKRESIRFYGPGMALNLGACKLHSPLVYVVPGCLATQPDASLIELGLPVSPSRSGVVSLLPYWPSYREATPEQRAGFLSWLASGRQDPEAQLGYVFIFFYGLERRVIIDHADHSAVVAELIRLSPIYSYSRSFRHYASSLLWWTIYQQDLTSGVASSQIDEAICATERWGEDELALCLAHFYHRREPLSPHAAFIVARHDARTPSSVIVSRHEVKFRELFLKKYKVAFPAGLELKAAKRDRRLYYRPASATLGGEHGGIGETLCTTVSHVAGLPSQFKPLLDLWSKCIEDLKAYDRAQRSADRPAVAYEALPDELRTEDHPEFDDWLRLWREYDTADSGPIIPISVFAKLKGHAQKTRLGKKLSNEILASADIMGFGIEPDARITCQDYRWEDKVGLFFCDDRCDEDVSAYQAAAIFLDLGMAIARADGCVDEDELSHIAQHLENRFSLSPTQTKRLECRRRLLLHSDVAYTRTAASLRSQLNCDQRLVIGEFLVAIAAVDSAFSEAEMHTLQQLYRLLGLGPDQLESIIHCHRGGPQDALTASTSCRFSLDMAVISRKMRETKEVAEILQRAMVDDEEARDESPSQSSDASSTRSVGANVAAPAMSGVDAIMPKDSLLGGLPSRYHSFLSLLLTREVWSHDELEAAARAEHLMALGAIESINEWAYDQFEDELLAEGANLTINLSLLQRIKEQR